MIGLSISLLRLTRNKWLTYQRQSTEQEKLHKLTRSIVIFFPIDDQFILVYCDDDDGASRASRIILNFIATECIFSLQLKQVASLSVIVSKVEICVRMDRFNGPFLDSISRKISMTRKWPHVRPMQLGSAQQQSIFQLCGYFFNFVFYFQANVRKYRFRINLLQISGYTVVQPFSSQPLQTWTGCRLY